MQSTEQWRPIVGYEGAYEVSDIGRVRSVDRIDSAGRRLRGRVLTPIIRARYRSVTLSQAGVHSYFYVHRLVATAFLPAPNPRDEVCHDDGDRMNNRATNLRWGTHSENALDMVRHGTHPEARKTHCKRGHAFTPENIYPNTGRRRVCIPCRRVSARKQVAP